MNENRGRSEPMSAELQNLSQLFSMSAARHPHSEAVVEGDVRLDYSAYLARGRQVATRLAAYGIVPGDRIGLLVPNGWRCAVAYVGLQLAGAVAVMVNTRLVSSEVAFVLENSGTRLVVSDDQMRGKLAESATIPFLHVDTLTDPARDDETTAPTTGERSLGGSSRASSDLANIVYTSGTTGRPKGAMITHANLLANARRIVTLASLGTADRTLVVTPMSQATAIHSQLPGFVLAGGALVFGGPFSRERSLALLAREHITVFIGVAKMLGLMLAHPTFSASNLGSLRLFVMGGSPVPVPLLAQGMRTLPSLKFANVWGLTEATSIVTWCAHESWAERPWSVGLAAEGVNVAIFREGDERPEDVREVVGELCVRGDILAAGYWSAFDATAETFRNGWLHTGDVGRVDGEGYVEILDRIEDTIIHGGENIYCLEVENALASHESVAEVAVVGIPDPLFGERVRAVVVLRDGAELTADELTIHAQTRLADYKIPVEYVFLPELPRNPGGKVQKRVLAGLLLRGAGRRSH